MTVEFPSTFKPHSFSNVVQGAIHHKLQNGWIYFLKENYYFILLNFQNFSYGNFAGSWDTQPSEIRTSQIRRFELGSKMFEVRWFCAVYQGASKQILHGFNVYFTWILLNTVSLNKGFSMQKFQCNIPNFLFSTVQKIKMFFMESETMEKFHLKWQ